MDSLLSRAFTSGAGTHSIEAVLQNNRSFLWFVQMFVLSDLLTGHFDSCSFAHSLKPTVVVTTSVVIEPSLMGIRKLSFSHLWFKFMP